MRRSSKKTLQHTAAATTMVGLVCLFAAGCSSGSSGGAEQVGVGDSYQQLASDLAKCADEGRACLRGARGDGGPGGAKACFDQVKTCRDAARASDEALRKAIEDCVTAARQCQSGGHGDGGAARGACRDELRACIEKNLPPPPSGLPSGLPPVPSGHPGGLPSGLPSGFPPVPSGLPSGLPPVPSGHPGGLPSGLPSGFPPVPSGLPSGFPPVPSGLPSGFPPVPSGLPSGFPPVPSGLPSGLPPVPSGRPPFQVPPCLQALSQCVQGGGTPADCVKQARACIMKDLMPGMSGTP